MSETGPDNNEEDVDEAKNGEAERAEFEIHTEPEADSATPGECAQCQDKCMRRLRPILTEYNFLPRNPDCLQKFHHAFFCPPHGRIGAAFFMLIVGSLWWGVLWSLTGENALPGGNLFALIVLFFCCWCGGYLMQLIRLPALLGMLLVGVILSNVPGISIAKDINHDWSSGARQIALSIILIRAGLGLDPAALRRLSLVVIRLAFSPCLAETVADGIAAHLILGFPWTWAFMLGFVIAAVSTAVVVPSLLSLAEQGYGVEKGIPTLVIAASSVDNVLAITGFGVVLGITFSSGYLAWNLAKGPLEVIIGILYGAIGGIILWYIPQKKSKHRLFFRSALLVGGGLLAIFGSKKLDWSGVGPVGCLTISFVAALRWRTELKKDEQDPIKDVVGVLWILLEPLLFGLIGAAVRIDALEGDVVGLGIAVLAIGLTTRMVVSYLAVLGTNLNLKERLFVTVAWLPKATVQAAIGAVAYDMTLEKGDDDLIALGEKILTLAVLSIILTAPTGAGLVTILGPRFLHRISSTDHLQGEVDLETGAEAAQTLQSTTSGGADLKNASSGSSSSESSTLNGHSNVDPVDDVGADECSTRL